MYTRKHVRTQNAFRSPIEPKKIRQLKITTNNKEVIGRKEFGLDRFKGFGSAVSNVQYATASKP